MADDASFDVADLGECGMEDEDCPRDTRYGKGTNAD
jgi:hypothetical protein